MSVICGNTRNRQEMECINCDCGKSSSVPAGYVAMPKSLTAENGAKTLLSGEFFVQVLETCDDCGGDGWENEEKGEPCHSCKGECSWYRKVPIPWTTIKMIYAKAVEHLAT